MGRGGVRLKKEGDIYKLWLKLLSRVRLFGPTVDSSPPGSSIHDFSNKNIGVAATSSSKGSSPFGDQTYISWVDLSPLSHKGNPYGTVTCPIFLMS